MSTPLMQWQVPPYVPGGVKMAAFNFVTWLKVFPVAKQDKGLFPQRQVGDPNQVVSSFSVPF